MRGESRFWRSRSTTRIARAVGIVAMLSASSPLVIAQGTFSIDYQGPPISLPDSCAGAPALTEGDILGGFFGGPAPGPMPVPCIIISGGLGGLGLPLHPAAVGHAPGVPGFVEVDALSYGRERPLRPGGPRNYSWNFSVDEFATGMGITPPPNVFSEGAAGAGEASADVFVDAGVGSGPFCAPPPVAGNFASLDGDGVLPFGGPGWGLMEPNPPGIGLPDPGANLDALDIDSPGVVPGVFPVYFSLDAPFADLAEGVPNTGSAGANGLGVGGDVFVVFGPGGPPVIFAPAPLLGLDMFGPDTDDLDALVLWENGSGVYEPSIAPYDWLGGATDMLLFSVRKGSAVIGSLDSLCGLPIEPGDILAPPVVAGGFPAIWIPAEALGLTTARAGFVAADDLDALDVQCSIVGDLNGDGVVDLTDLGLLLGNYGCVSPPACAGDVNGDGVVDLTDLGLLLGSYGAKC